MIKLLLRIKRKYIQTFNGKVQPVGRKLVKMTEEGRGDEEQNMGFMTEKIVEIEESPNHVKPQLKRKDRDS